MSKLVIKKHYFYEVATKIQEICKPLEKFGIYHFNYIKNYDNGYQVHLSNNAQWLEGYYESELFRDNSFEANPQQFSSGFIFWPRNSKQKFYKYSKSNFANNCGITVIRRLEKASEFYFFSGIGPNEALINFYINNIDILNRFIVYFKDRAAQVINHAERNKIYLHETYRQIHAFKDAFLSDSLQYCNHHELRNEFFKETELTHYTTADNITITRRELDCIEGLLKRMTVNEIAQSLSLSKRTVQTYMRRLKLKFKCKSIKSLIDIVSQESF